MPDKRFIRTSITIHVWLSAGDSGSDVSVVAALPHYLEAVTAVDEVGKGLRKKLWSSTTSTRVISPPAFGRSPGAGAPSGLERISRRGGVSGTRSEPLLDAGGSLPPHPCCAGRNQTAL
jgi:hypothetical protein